MIRLFIKNQAQKMPTRTNQWSPLKRVYLLVLQLRSGVRMQVKTSMEVDVIRIVVLVKRRQVVVLHH